MKTWLFTRCTLDRVIDGDSMRLVVDTGFHHSANVHVRLLGVDCPERKDPEGWRLAREFAINWLADSMDFILECHGVDKYGGRWLGKIINSEGESLSQSLIDSGFGVPYFGGKKT